jgi:hypothetical protein
VLHRKCEYANHLCAADDERGLASSSRRPALPVAWACRRTKVASHHTRART